MKAKKTIMVSNAWQPEKAAICKLCGKDINYKWGDYSFRYYQKKDKSDLCVICKSCAATMKNKDHSVRVVRKSQIIDFINLINSGWKTQKKD